MTTKRHSIEIPYGQGSSRYRCVGRVFKKNENVAKFLFEDVGLHRMVISYITLIELIKGATDKQSLKVLESVLSDFPVLYNTKNSSEKAVELIRQYHLSHNLKLPDGSIAAICITNNLPLLTLNVKDFKFIKELDMIPHKLKPKSS